jgi:hypothetical protein
MSRVRMQGCGKADVGRLRQSPGDTLRIRRVRRPVLQTLRVRDLNKNAPRLGAKKWFLNTIFYPMAALVVGDKCSRINKLIAQSSKWQFRSREWMEQERFVVRIVLCHQLSTLSYDL